MASYSVEWHFATLEGSGMPTSSSAGRMRQLFDQASKLPRGKQEKIVAILEPFIREHAGSGS